jgi:hypothetical protein
MPSAPLRVAFFGMLAVILNVKPTQTGDKAALPEWPFKLKFCINTLQSDGDRRMRGTVRVGCPSILQSPLRALQPNRRSR